MSKLRINCAMLAPGIQPIFKFDIAAADEKQKGSVMRSISKIIEIAINKFDAKLVITDHPIEALIDNEYPFGACCMIYFSSHNDGIEFIKQVINTL